MTTAAILGILAALIPLLVYLVKRHVEKKDDPVQQNLARKAEADRAVVRGDADAVNALLESDLRRLQNPKRHGDTQ